MGRSHAQAPYLNQIDIAVGGTGQFTRTVPYQDKSMVDSTTEAAGALLSVREHSHVWAGLEENYQYSHFYNTYSSPGTATLQSPVKMHELSAAYLIGSHSRAFAPFIALGGGALFFSKNASYQISPTGLVEVGVDLPTANPHFGLRIQGRGLFYQGQQIAPSTQKGPWLVTAEPSLNFYLRF